MKRLKLPFDLTPTDTIHGLNNASLNFLRVICIPHLRESMSIPTKVLKEVGVFMQDRSNNILHGGGMIPENIDGIFHGIILTISGSILLPQCANTILKGPTFMFGPKVFFTPFNGLTNNITDLTNGHLRGGGL